MEEHWQQEGMKEAEKSKQRAEKQNHELMEQTKKLFQISLDNLTDQELSDDFLKQVKHLKYE